MIGADGDMEDAIEASEASGPADEHEMEEKPEGVLHEEELKLLLLLYAREIQPGGAGSRILKDVDWEKFKFAFALPAPRLWPGKNHGDDDGGSDDSDADESGGGGGGGGSGSGGNGSSGGGGGQHKTVPPIMRLEFETSESTSKAVLVRRLKILETHRYCLGCDRVVQKLTDGAWALLESASGDHTSVDRAGKGGKVPLPDCDQTPLDVSEIRTPCGWTVFSTLSPEWNASGMRMFAIRTRDHFDRVSYSYGNCFLTIFHNKIAPLKGWSN